MHAITNLIYTQEYSNVRPSAMRHHALHLEDNRLSKGWPIEKALSMEDFRCRHVRHETV